MLVKFVLKYYIMNILEKSEKTLEFDNPKEQKEYELTLNCKEGYNLISVKVYAEEEQIYAEDSGECEYNP